MRTAATSLTFLIWSAVLLLAGHRLKHCRKWKKPKLPGWPPPKPRASRFPSHATVRRSANLCRHERLVQRLRIFQIHGATAERFESGESGNRLSADQRSYVGARTAMSASPFDVTNFRADPATRDCPRSGASEGRAMDFTPPAAAFKRVGLKPFGFFCVRDSMSHRSRLKRAVAFLQQHAHRGRTAVCRDQVGHVIVIDIRNRQRRWTRPHPSFSQAPLQTKPTWGASCCVFRANKLIEIWLFDRNLAFVASRLLTLRG
jgi:hypothetical protein